MIKRAHCFHQRRLGIGTVGIENIDIFQPHPFETLIETRQHIFPRTTIAIRATPHRVTRLGGNDHLIAIRKKIIAKDFPKIGFRRAGRRTVIIGEIKMRYAQIERLPE